jgi:adenosine deaminase
MSQPVLPTPSKICLLPKIDLHRHLLGSARVETLWSLARKYDLDSGRLPLSQFRSLVVHRGPQGSLDRYIRPWKIFRMLIREPEDVHLIAREAAEDARADGVSYVEFRSSLPGMPLTDGRDPQTQIPPDQYLDAISAGFAAVQGITCRLIASIIRHASGVTQPRILHRHTDRFLDALAPFRHYLVVGADLTGIERGWSASLFKECFAAVGQAGLPVTIHAGETEGPDEIWIAIEDLGARRIGHGTSASEDPLLVQALIERNVVLEVSPTAGWLIGRLQGTASHPIIGCIPPVPYVICTDNPAVNASSHSDELLIAARIAGDDAANYTLRQFEAAREAAFASVDLLETSKTRHWSENRISHDRR